MQNTRSVKFEKYINYFNEYLICKHYSQNTIDDYTRDTKLFLLFVENNYIRINNIIQITKQIINDYNNYLIFYKYKNDKNYSNKTVILKLLGIKKFFEFLFKSDYIIHNPAATLELPREEKSLPRNILTEDEVFKILESINTNTPIGLRNKTIIELFYSSAIRTSELANIKINDVDFKDQTIIILKGKGNKTRKVPLTQYACEYIKLYLQKARKYLLKGRLKDDGYLFLTTKGTPFNRYTLNSCVISSIMKKIKLNKPVSCYSFRHYVEFQIMPN